MDHECIMCGHYIKDDEQASCPHMRKDQASIGWSKFGQWLILHRDSYPDYLRDDYELALIYPGVKPVDE